jgi:hypothetical protein
MSLSTTDKGKAFEHACAKAIRERFGLTLICNSASKVARERFERLDAAGQKRLMSAANAGVSLLGELEDNLYREGGQIEIQPDSKGKSGDVRDLVISNSSIGWEFGISAKHNHSAVKHSRISATIDIGREWLGYNSTAQYFEDITPIFNRLSSFRDRGLKWGEVKDKARSYYAPSLEAVRDEIMRLDEMENDVPARLVQYLVGNHDFYKVIAWEKWEVTRVEAFSLNGTLDSNRVAQVKLPKELIRVDFKSGSDNTLEFVFDGGWQISARIHNAESKVVPSLKLDVQLVGTPSNLFQESRMWT